jgi:hypothetical protein
VGYFAIDSGERVFPHPRYIIETERVDALTDSMDTKVPIDIIV